MAVFWPVKTPEVVRQKEQVIPRSSTGKTMKGKNHSGPWSLLSPWAPWGACSSHSHFDWKFLGMALISTEEN